MHNDRQRTYPVNQEVLASLVRLVDLEDMFRIVIARVIVLQAGEVRVAGTKVGCVYGRGVVGRRGPLPYV